MGRAHLINRFVARPGEKFGIEDAGQKGPEAALGPLRTFLTEDDEPGFCSRSQ